MKKTLFFAIFTLIALSSFAQEGFQIPTRDIYIEGTAEVSSHRAYFLDNFKMEAVSLGFNVVNSSEAAGYTFKFDSQRYGNEFIVLITLILNEGDMEIVSFGWPYSNLDEMYEYNQFVFFKAVVLIPGIDEDELRALMEEERVDTRWQRQFMYVRFSFDYPISFYTLMPDGLYTPPDEKLPIAAYIGDKNNPYFFQLLDHYTIALPALTVGVEFQPIKYLGIEANIHAKLGEPKNNWILNLIAGAQVKAPIRFKHIMLEPYGAFMYPLAIKINGEPLQLPSNQTNSSKGFEKYPKYFIGGGIQANIKGGKKNAFFVDVNFMFAPAVSGNETVYRNILDGFEPAGIHYNHFVVGIGIGYKLGFFQR
jgi:hypothetical protein